MSSFCVSYMEVSFPCSKETFNKIVAEYEEEEGSFTDLAFDYSDDDQEGILSNKDNLVFHDFDDQIKAFNEICLKYDTYVEGYYLGDWDSNDTFRVDIRGDKPEAQMFDSHNTYWLLAYTAEQMRAIQEEAHRMFPDQPTDRSDSSEE